MEATPTISGEYVLYKNDKIDDWALNSRRRHESFLVLSSRVFSFSSLLVLLSLPFALSCEPTDQQSEKKMKWRCLTEHSQVMGQHCSKGRKQISDG